MITHRTSIGGNPATLQGDRTEIRARVDFTSGAAAAGFSDGLRASGFAPRTLENDGTWIVALTTTPAELTRLLRP